MYAVINRLISRVEHLRDAACLQNHGIVDKKGACSILSLLYARSILPPKILPKYIRIMEAVRERRYS